MSAANLMLIPTLGLTQEAGGESNVAPIGSVAVEEPIGEPTTTQLVPEEGSQSEAPLENARKRRRAKQAACSASSAERVADRTSVSGPMSSGVVPVSSDHTPSDPLVDSPAASLPPLSAQGRILRSSINPVPASSRAAHVIRLGALASPPTNFFSSIVVSTTTTYSTDFCALVLGSQSFTPKTLFSSLLSMLSSPANESQPRVVVSLHWFSSDNLCSSHSSQATFHRSHLAVNSVGDWFEVVGFQPPQHRMAGYFLDHHFD
ncbi:hypothetical protein ZIOFF_000927 [Zingiber officinale]|uniref:Uncharacterized protein n=1 Tax=Zingiber officinale TaxID=94328 RepID=A0A8J5I1L9_ZINOF|nr:hypothetical protein ZIOFF_000927 [Zingiber officinale]